MPSDADLGRTVEELERELAEAREQQAATSEILRVISNSPTELQPVLDAVAESAARLCGAKDAHIFRIAGDRLHMVSSYGRLPVLDGFEEGILISREWVTGRAVVDRQSVQVDDLAAESEVEFLRGRDYARRFGHRTTLATPLLREGTPVGGILIRRNEVRPFSDKQIKLLETFSNQAVIAIENTRLFEEVQARTRELAVALEQQTATADALKVISRSAFDLQRVLDALVASAASLCGASRALIYRYDGHAFRIVATHNASPELREYLERNPIFVTRGSLAGRVFIERHTIQIQDVLADPEYTYGSKQIDPIRTVLGVPLFTASEFLGVIVIYRHEVVPFTDGQIALLETFADQAVIAIENTRLFEAEQTRTAELQVRSAELAQSLEYQTAISNVLDALSRSPNELQPVLDTIVVAARRLCDAERAIIWRPEGEAFRAVAYDGLDPSRIAQVKVQLMPVGLGSMAGRAVEERRAVQVQDVTAEPSLSATHDFNRAGDIHTALAVPLLLKGEPAGAITVSRTVVSLFSEKQIELLETFADQAVIAIENTRLFEAEQARTRELTERTQELTESLEYQTATSDVLSVISRSKSDIQPVFDAIVQSAAKLFDQCTATITTLKDGLLHWNGSAALHPAFDIQRMQAVYPVPIDPDRVPSARAMLDRRVIVIPDAQAPDTPEYTRKTQVAGGFRSITFVPLVSQDKGIGTIILTHPQAGFTLTENQLALAKTFADQAVIAIENTRLLNELRESLQQQTATADVLKVISRSTFDLQPVLNTLAESATHLCRADNAILYRLDQGACRFAAGYGHQSEFVSIVRTIAHPPGPGTAVGRAVSSRQTVHIEDTLVDPQYALKDLAQKMQVRSLIGVPLLKNGEPIGAFALARSRVEAFNTREIGLIETFADQAVIAIENTRLFEAEQTRTKELQESLEYQTASSQVLEAISRSPTLLMPVLQTISEMAARMCGNRSVAIWLPEGEAFRLRVTWGLSDKYREIEEAVRLRPERGSIVGRVALTRQVEHIHDCLQDPEYAFKEDARIGGVRTILGVPLLRAGEVVGVVTLWRYEVDPFTEKQIEMVSTFASQAVIAIENTRLFEAEQASKRELTESLEYQTATGDILRVISSSPTDIKPVFDTISTNALRLCGASFSAVLLFDGEFIRLQSPHNLSDPVAIEALTRAFPRRPHQGGATDRAILTGSVVHIPDVSEDPAYQHRELALATNYRSILSVPMLRERQTVGAITVAATAPGAFSQRQVKLLQTFADQAVIAIENTRLFEEVTALGEVGRAVSSTLDLNVVLKTIVERAVELSHTDAGSIYYYRRDVGKFELGETTGLDEGAIGRFRTLDIAAGQTGLGEAIAKGQPLQVADISKRASNALRDAALEAGFRAALIVPLLGSEEPLGALVLQRRRPGEFSEAVVTLMQSFADQSVIALENARLFEEIAQKSRELEVTSQHKSQFVANMSHELRTPLAAILGYAELMQEGFYGALSEKSTDALTRIRSNGKHLLGLINTVLDIAKIESGQFSLNLGEYAVESVVETVRAATKSLAETKKLSLKTDVTKKLPVGLGDEQRLTQVLLNLVGNAIKFTDIGEVRITATAMNGHFTVAVTDTGPGIPAEELKRVFEQFHQIDNSNTKAKGGTGLGLAIAKQIVEMHGGRIWVESTLGQGATFQMELPIRAEDRKGV